MPLRARGFALAAVLASGCRASPPHLPPETPTAPAAPEARDHGWTERTLAELSLAEKAAQLVAVRAPDLSGSPRSEAARGLQHLVADVGVGTVVVFESEVESLPPRLNDLQRRARVPLLVAADMERGMAFRVRRGVVPLPYAMAIGAAGSEEAARASGEIAAREGRALGVHWAFAPVADVNSNPANPVINIRSFGEDPRRVGRLAAAFIRGARTGGLMTTAKHFPGHGDTAVDSHLALATIAGDASRLDAVELVPFRSALAAGVDAVMLGHIAAPGIDPSGTPATLSPVVVGELLRERLGFEGLIVTDALEMGGLGAGWGGRATVEAVRAGADMVLLPPDPEVAVRSLVRAVSDGRLSERRLDASARRVLAAKERLGLSRRRLVAVDALGDSVARPADLDRAEAIARASITLVQNRGGAVPIRAETRPRLLHVALTSDFHSREVEGLPEAELARRGLDVRSVRVGPDLTPATARGILGLARRASHVLVSAFVRITGSKGTADMREDLAELVRELSRGETPVIVTSFGSPYLLRQFPEVDAYLCAYGGARSSQAAAVAAVLGEIPVGGRLPVGLPGLYDVGHGIQMARHEMTLREGTPSEAGLDPGPLRELGEVIERHVAARAFPGAVVAIGHDGVLGWVRAYGRTSYGAGGRDVEVDTIYDLASLTKVVVTTTLAMMLVDEGRLDLDRPVSAFLPRFEGGGRERVTVRQLLTHSSGLDWWAPLYEELRGREAYLERIQAMDLVYAPDSRALYSDLGTILLGEIIRRVSGRELEVLARERILEPLGMRDTGFRPDASLLPRIAPTELESWRGRTLHGEVHDANAFAMGGVAPHAGLFGTARDLARFAQMMLNGGVYDHRRLVRAEIVDRFTRRYPGIPRSTRALGWDTPEDAGDSSAGRFFSRRSYGHTGFTGTSLWIDPERNLFAILLTNRVHPTRQNPAILRARADVADSAMRALLGREPGPRR